MGIITLIYLNFVDNRLLYTSGPRFVLLVVHPQHPQLELNSLKKYTNAMKYGLVVLEQPEQWGEELVSVLPPKNDGGLVFLLVDEDINFDAFMPAVAPNRLQRLRESLPHEGLILVALGFTLPKDLELLRGQCNNKKQVDESQHPFLACEVINTPPLPTGLYWDQEQGDMVFVE